MSPALRRGSIESVDAATRRAGVLLYGSEGSAVTAEVADHVTLTGVTGGEPAIVARMDDGAYVVLALLENVT